MNDPVSLQLYSVREALQKNFRFTMQTVAEMGYTGVEFAGIYGGMKASELRVFLDSLGLRPVGAHVGIDALENDFDAQADYLAELGCGHMVCPYAPMNDEASAADIGRRLETAAQKCAMRGFRFSYHNHGHEYQMTEDGRYLLDVMMGECSELVMAELDVYWVTYGGADPISEIRKYAGREELLHLKQMGFVDGVKKDVLFDRGVLDLAEIAEAGKKMGITELIVEEETETDDMVDAVRVDIETLRRL